MGEGFMTAQEHMQFWFKVVIFFGVVLIIGVLITFWNMLTAHLETVEAPVESD